MTIQPVNIEKLITSRRTIHNFIPNKIPDESVIKRAIETACWAPNHHLTEPWHFYLLGAATITSICDLNKKLVTIASGEDAAEKKYLRWLSIPGWIIVTSKRSNDEIIFNEDYAACCCAIQNLMLSLWSKGIGTKWSTGEITRNDEFYDIVWVNRDLENIIGIVWYGYPEDVTKTVRKNLSESLTQLP